MSVNLFTMLKMEVGRKQSEGQSSDSSQNRNDVYRYDGTGTSSVTVLSSTGCSVHGGEIDRRWKGELSVGQSSQDRNYVHRYDGACTSSVTVLSSTDCCSTSDSSVHGEIDRRWEGEGQSCHDRNYVHRYDGACTSSVTVLSSTDCSSTSDSVHSEIDRRCSVCLELFVEPKVLPCCHTFCLKCLEKTKSGGEITCPHCRITHKIPGGALKNLLTDYIAMYEAEVAGLKSSNSRKLKVQVCDECERSGPIRCYCSDCKNYLCDECGLQIHKRLKSFRGHKVIPIEEINATILQSHQIHYCGTHKNEALKLFCKTCSKLICRDCTLVDHRQHNYAFVEEARKHVEGEVASLRAEVEQKLRQFQRNLQEIKKVEVSATGHPEVVKADINTFFDKLVRCIEERRKVLMQQAEANCQKDLKQIWADKSFHEMTILHISSVFGLADKAKRSTSDSEMILTSLHAITQLKKLKETEWDSTALSTVVSSTPKFSEGTTVKVETVGKVVAQRDSTQPSSNIEVVHLKTKARVGRLVTFRIKVTNPPSAEKHLFDSRSGAHINLTSSTPSPFVVVHYGHSAKELDSKYISLQRVSEERKCLQGSAKPRICIPGTQEASSPWNSKAATPSRIANCLYDVSIQLICGGKHTLKLHVGDCKVTHPFTVTGEAQHGTKVQRGPDWEAKRFADMPACENTDNVIGTISSNSQYDDAYHRQVETYGYANPFEQYRSFACGDRNNNNMVTVIEHSGNVRQYKWGKDSKYEIELVV